jgi:hypothetical protein
VRICVREGCGSLVPEFKNQGALYCSRFCKKKAARLRYGHKPRSPKTPWMPCECACGCGTLAASYHKYARGHRKKHEATPEVLEQRRVRRNKLKVLREAIWRRLNPEKAKKKRNARNAREKSNMTDGAKRKRQIKNRTLRNKVRSSSKEKRVWFLWKAARGRCRKSQRDFDAGLRPFPGRVFEEVASQELLTNIPDMCPCCDKTMSWLETSGKGQRTFPNAPSIDRVNSSLGYVVGNVRIICYRCNSIKSFGTSEDHLRIHLFMAAHEASKLVAA